MENNVVSCEVSGIPVSLNVGCLSSFRTLGLFARGQKGDITAMYEYAELIFGAEQLENILNSLPDDSIPTVMQFISDAMSEAAKANAGELKN